MLADAYRGVVCDLDGVVRRGSSAVPYAVEMLAVLSSRSVPVVFATNNASLTPGEVARQLAGLGLDERLVGPESVVTSSQAGAAHLAATLHAGAAVLAVGGPGVASALSAAGLQPVSGSDDARTVEAVLQGYGPTVSAADLAAASYAIQSGATWVATNLDATLPTQHGIAPGNGALVGAVATATGTRPVAVGKPESPLYDLAVSRLGCRPTEALAIGDRLDTDILGAMAAGLDSLWVLTGVDSLVSFAAAGGRAVPTFTATDLRALVLPPPWVRFDHPAWICGPVRLTVDWTAGTALVDGAERAATGANDPVAWGNAVASAAVAALVFARDERQVPTEALVRVAEEVTRAIAGPGTPSG